jgi:hypothetical protein
MNVTEGAIGSAEGKQEGASRRCMEGLVGRREKRGIWEFSRKRQRVEIGTQRRAMEVERLVWLRVVLCLALASHEALLSTCMHVTCFYEVAQRDQNQLTPAAQCRST